MLLGMPQGRPGLARQAGAVSLAAGQAGRIRRAGQAHLRERDAQRRDHPARRGDPDGTEIGLSQHEARGTRREDKQRADARAVGPQGPRCTRLLPLESGAKPHPRLVPSRFVPHFAPRAFASCLALCVAPLCRACVTMQEASERFVHWFRSAAPYIHAFRGRTFVVAFGGEVVADGKLRRAHARPESAGRAWRSPGAGARRAAADRSPAHRARHAPTLCARCPRHRRGRAGQREAGERPAARGDRGAAVDGVAQLAHGQCARSGSRAAISSPPGRAAWWTVSTCNTRAKCAQIACRRDTPPARCRGAGAAVAARLFAHGRDVQPDDGGRCGGGRDRARGGQAHLPD